MNEEERLAQAVSRTQVLRPPKQTLATFGVTNISYYLLTRPAYAAGDEVETVVRMGCVIANRPRIVTPYYLSRLDGFSTDARRYFQKLIETHGADTPGIYYTYRNEPHGTDIISNGIEDVLAKINAEIDARNDPLAAIIRGEDLLWDVSLLKFIFEMTSASLGGNLADFRSRGLLDVAGGVPAEARLSIEDMFRQLKEGTIEPHELQQELERWGLFEAYQDRFLANFRR
jgi:hypothetical protein